MDKAYSILDEVRAMLAETEAPQHKGGGAYGQTHAADCPACVKDHADRLARMGNPHRVGTKAHARREAENASAARACDLRSELYWTM